jgi:hypothetical protein
VRRPENGCQGRAELRKQPVCGVEVYLTHIPGVADIEERRGLRDFGAKRSNQFVIWESLSWTGMHAGKRHVRRG